MQETTPERIVPVAIERLNAGESLERLVSAGALANARAFGGHDYTGYHTFMALLPAYQMTGELPTEQRALPLLKVLHRNSQRIHNQGADDHDSLTPCEETSARSSGDVAPLQQTIRNRELAVAEQDLAVLCRESPAAAYDALQYAVQDEMNVHRVVLAWRAWAMLDLAGPQFAHTFLRQSVRFCIDSENQMHSRGYAASPIRTLLPQLLDEHHLVGKELGNTPADDARMAELVQIIYGGSREEAAAAVATALAEGMDPTAVGEALALASNQLVLRDPGRLEENASPEKPAGCVHGDSVGVHASDSANAWRNIARVSPSINKAASLIVGAYHTAGQARWSADRDFSYAAQLAELQMTDRAQLLAEAEAAIKAGNQAQACAVAQKYGDLGHTDRPLQDLFLRYAISEDGALHAEKYYRTAIEEYAATRPAYRWRQMVALARVTASQHGHPAPGYQQARELLGLA
jgi:hypothetical protein